MTRTTALIALALAATLVAGCLETPVSVDAGDLRGDDVDPASTSASERADALERSAAAARGEMTAEERVEEDEGVDGGVPPYVATRTHTIEGRLTLAALPVILATTNGPITITGGDDGAWRLVATLEGRGGSPEDARAALERLTFTWSHETPRGHRLLAEVTYEEPTDDVVPGVRIGLGGMEASGSLELVVPRGLLLDAAADTTNGPIRFTDLTASALFGDTTNAAIAVTNVRAGALGLDSTNGAITLDGVAATRVDADTTNGAITADVTPLARGEIILDSTNGAIDLRVPETARFGYDAELDTTNGRATVDLEDGRTEREDPDEAHFVSTGFAARAITVEVSLDSTNGNVRIGPQ